MLLQFIKKAIKKTAENYRPVSLLPVCGKVFERLIYNSLFEFFIENELLFSNQSDFKPGDSCINQLLPITHEICKSLMIDMKSEVFSFIYQKHLIKFGTIDSCMN